jgi:DNA-binding MarR family transcriptional regulator
MSNNLNSTNIRPEDSDSQADIVAAFSEVFGKLMRYASTDWINLDLSTAQIKVIFTLHYSGAYTINHLAERLNIGAPTTSHLVEKLVQAGYAVRVDSTTDRRVVEVHLTEQGHEVANRLWGTRNQIITTWISQLAPEQRRSLGENLQALLVIINDSAHSDIKRNTTYEESRNE